MKTEAIERLINAVDVWVATGVFENTVFSPITDDAKEELKAINVIQCCGDVVCGNCDGYCYTVDENSRRKEHCKECE